MTQQNESEKDREAFEKLERVHKWLYSLKRNESGNYSDHETSTLYNGFVDGCNHARQQFSQREAEILKDFKKVLGEAISDCDIFVSDGADREEMEEIKSELLEIKKKWQI